MFKHVIAPRRFFLQVPNDVIRHPRLSCDAKALLLYVLSLPEAADEALQRSAEKVGLKKGAFTVAKRQLLAEGYLHEWREQGTGGRWGTEQLVANVPIGRDEADRTRRGESPSVREPAVGGPSGRAVGHYQEHPGGNTPNPPPGRLASEALGEHGTLGTPGVSGTPEMPDGPAAPDGSQAPGCRCAAGPGGALGEPAAADVPGRPEASFAPDAGEPPEPQPAPDAGRAAEAGPAFGAASPAQPDRSLLRQAAFVLAGISHGEPRLRLGGQDIAPLASLAAQWLARGCPPEQLRLALTAGLPGTVRNPAGLLRDRLRRKMPLPDQRPTPQSLPLPSQRSAAPTAVTAGAKAGIAECDTCRDPLPRGQRDGSCRRCAAAAPLPAPSRSGLAAVRAALGHGPVPAFALP